MSDYIKRDELAQIVRRYFSENYITDGDWHADGLLREIDDIPAADVRPVVRGEWVDTNAVIGIATETDHVQIFAHRCSLCGELFPSYWTRNFCPNCGADMRGEEE
jgi:hypothetical protein